MVVVGIPADSTLVAGDPPRVMVTQRLNIKGIMTEKSKEVDESMDLGEGARETTSDSWHTA